MARLVKRTRIELTQYAFGDKEVWLCKCGRRSGSRYATARTQGNTDLLICRVSSR
jgi:hypothetical protein